MHNYYHNNGMHKMHRLPCSLYRNTLNKGIAVENALSMLSLLVIGSKSPWRGSVYETVNVTSDVRLCDSLTKR